MRVVVRQGFYCSAPLAATIHITMYSYVCFWHIEYSVDSLGAMFPLPACQSLSMVAHQVLHYRIVSIYTGLILSRLFQCVRAEYPKCEVVPRVPLHLLNNCARAPSFSHSLFTNELQGLLLLAAWTLLCTFPDPMSIVA